MLWIVSLFIHILLVDARSIENDVENDNTTDTEFARNNCVLSMKYKYGDLKEPQPLILTRNGTASAILYPNINGTLKVQTDQSIYLACPGEQNSLRNMNYAQEVKATCLSTFQKLLNSSELAKSHLAKSRQFLSRGHLTAMVDFVYGALQSLTFWYINAAPQWMSFNAGNWERLENSIRNFSTYRSLDLDVYTGVHGQMTLPNARGKQQDIYLYVNGTNKAVPVPKFYWKIIYDPRSKKGTAFVGLNDPFIKSITEDIYICSDISSEIKWLLWRPNDIKAGISYACTVDDLRKAVPTIPKFQTVGILT
uniref:DNA/RNA non-specific endonuclease/pyrophosphatase/phosphodiesterase domain-containing protein n=1 Tax=Vespula pensylvanica TaxID=30213 RepID=A0A834PC46_VESPE|nr:hypothetical protein H0235_003591 [Vespula pensylvanica]